MLGTAKTDCLLLGEARTTNHIDIFKNKMSLTWVENVCTIHLQQDSLTSSLSPPLGFLLSTNEHQVTGAAHCEHLKVRSH